MKIEKGAFLTLVIVTAWSLTSTLLHMITPVDFDKLGATALIGFSLLGIALIPLYLREITWGYLAGIYQNLIVIGAGVSAIFEKSYFFSPTIYNFSVILVFSVSLIGLLLNYISFIRSNKLSRKRTMIAALIVLVLSTALMYPAYANYGTISKIRANQIQKRINEKLDGLESINEKINFLVEEGDIPSLVVGIVVKNKLIYSEAFGGASIKTAYSCGSVTKMFTATAIMQLYEKGEIHLDEPIDKYLPFEVRHPMYPDLPISVRLLLSHQSGLNHLTIFEETYYRSESQINWLSETHGWEINQIDPYPSLSEYIEGLVSPAGQYYTEEVWTNVEPGTVHVYSNTNYVLLSALIEQVSGVSFSEYIKENVLGPLKMNDSVFDYSKVEGEYATGYEREYGVLSKTNVKVPNYSKVPGPGGLITTVEDLSRFMISQMIEEENVLSEESISLMHEKAVDGGGHINKAGYGLGFTLLSKEAWEYYGEFYGLNGAIGHEGGQIGYVGSFYFVEKEEGGYGIILLSNLSTIENGVDFGWYFPIYYRIHILLMEEAKQLYLSNEI